jgi:hypothetical protein
MAKKGDWVRIHSVVLPAGERAAAVPDDTKRVPLELWTKGYLRHDAVFGGEASVMTRTGRIEHGTLIDDAPHYEHSFGEFVPELQRAGDDAFAFLFGGEG